MSSNMTSFSNNTSALSRLSAVAQHLVFTLLLLALGVTNAQAAGYPSKFSMALNDAAYKTSLKGGQSLDLSTMADITGGTAEVVNSGNGERGVIDSNGGTLHVRLNSGVDVYLHVKMNKALVAGDTIGFTTNLSTAGFLVTTSTTRLETYSTVNVSNGKAYFIVTNEFLNNQNNVKDFYLWSDIRDNKRGYLKTLFVNPVFCKYTLIANLGDSEKELSKGFVGDEGVTVFYPKVIEKGGSFYETSGSTFSHTFLNATNNTPVTETINYTLNSDIKGFIEGEASNAANASNSAYSNGDYGYVASRNAGVVAERLLAGEYTYTVRLVSNGGRALVLRDLDNADANVNYVAVPEIDKNSTAQEYSVDFKVYRDTRLGITGYTVNSGKTNQSADFDYAYIKWKGSVTPVESIALSNTGSVAVGYTRTLSIKWTPSEPTNKTVTWSSSDTNIATVDADGTVHGIAVGTAVITATAKGGDNVKAEYTISVTGSSGIDNLTAISSDYTFIPSQELVSGVMYDDNHILSGGGNSFYVDGVRVKGTGTYLAFKVDKEARVRVTFKSRAGSDAAARTAYINNSLTNVNAVDGTLASGETKTIEAYSSGANNYYIFTAPDNDLYVTKIEVIVSKYTVTYHYANNGFTSVTESYPASGMYLMGREEEYGFLGWSTQSDGTVVDAGKAGELFYPTQNTDLYAVYLSNIAPIQGLEVNGHTLVPSGTNKDTYTYVIGNAHEPSTISVKVTPYNKASLTIKEKDGGNVSTGSEGESVTFNATIGTEYTAIATSGGSTKNYSIKVTRASNLSITNDAYTIADQTYYEGQKFTSDHIDAWISPTAGGNDLNSIGSNYGNLTAYSQSYTGDVTYSYRLVNSYGNNPSFDKNTGVPSYGAYYAFKPKKSGVLEVAVNIGKDKTLYVSNGDKILTHGSDLGSADYITSFTLSSGATTANVDAGSIRINVEANKTYYVYGANTKLGLLGFALNQYLYVTSGSQTFTLSSENLDDFAYFTKENAATSCTHEGATIYRVKNTNDKVLVKVKGANGVAGVIYNSGGNGRKFCMTINGSAQTTETAATGESTSSYYDISSYATTGTTVGIAGAGSDVYAYQLIFSKTIPSVITVTKGSKAVTSDEIYVDETPTYTVTSTNTDSENSPIILDATGVSSFATVTLSSGTLSITPTKAGEGYIKLSQDAYGNYDAGERQFYLIVKKHELFLTITHSGADSYTKTETSHTGSYKSASDTGDGGTTTDWTITARKDNRNDGVVVTGLTYKFFSDDKSIATVDETTGAVALVSGGIGTANITVYYVGDASLKSAKTDYTITQSRGYNVKILGTGKDYKPALNQKYAAVNGTDTLCTMIACGYKYNKGTVFKKDGKDLTDSWHEPSPYEEIPNPYSCQIDGFINQSQAEQDSRNEYNKKVAWMADNIADTVYRQRVEPFTLPVRGAYLKFEPTVNGVLTAYVLQNGDISTGNDHLPNGIGGLPRIYYWFDQDGYRIPPTSVTSKLPLCYGRDYTNSSEIQVFNDPDKPNNNLEHWYELYDNENLRYLYEDNNGAPQWPTQAQVDANLAKIIPDPQPVVRLDSGYCVHQKAYVKYVLNVVAGNTYYFFSNNSKVGFAGYNFQPASTNTITCKAFDANGTEKYLTVTRNSSSQALDQEVEAVTSLKPNTTYAITQYDQITFNRKFKVDTWNSITLPFPLTETQVQKVFGAGTKLMLYNGLEGSTAHFIRHVDQNILAGQPYFIKPTGKKWGGTADLDNVGTTAGVKYVGGNGGLTFKGVNVSFTLEENTNYGSNRYVSDLYEEPSASYVVVGTLKKTTVNNGDYYINANDGNLYELQSNNTVQLNAYRAYLKQNSANAAKISSVNYLGLDGVEWDWEEEVTGIMEVLVNDMGVEIAPVQGVFNLNGQKVGDSTKGLPAGLYIVNGKVINIK